MRHSFLAVVFASTAFAQRPAPIGTLLGSVVEVSSSGLIDFKAGSGALLRCRYDDATVTERSHNRVETATLIPSEAIEITTDRKLGACYAQKIRVIDKAALEAKIPLRPTRLAILDQLFPRGNLTYAGVVLRHNNDTLVLRTRTEGEKILRLRDDTKFLDSGTPGDLSKLVPNTRVFVRAGKNLENELEVYQIIWGRIEGPSPGAR